MARRLEIWASESVISFRSKVRAQRWIAAFYGVLLALTGALSTPIIASAQSQPLEYIDFGQPPRFL